MKNFVQLKNILLGGAAVGMFLVPALAQDDMMETVTVTGIRASLQSAQSIKQNADQVVDSITAVDIGALPDRNVAEALQRVPGVTLQRNDTPNDLVRMGSTGNSVFVRGLSWVKTLVNGRDEFTAKNGRSLSFADVSADLMAGVNVYKSPTAEMIEGGVGGVVDLITRKPFDNDGLTIAVSGDLTYGDLADRGVPSANVLVSNRWQTGLGEFGALVSVDWQDQFTRTLGINMGEMQCWNTATGTHAKETAAADYATCMSLDLGTERVMAPEGWAWRQMEFHQQRLATNLVLQWRPSDNLEFTLFGMNTYANVVDLEHYVYAISNSTQIQASNFDSDSVWTGGPATISTIDTRGGKGHNRNTDIGLNVKFTPNDNLDITADLQFVESSSPYKNVTFFTAQSSGQEMMIDASDKSPTISYSDTGLNDVAGNYRWNAAMDHLDDNVGHAFNARIDAKYRFDGDGLFGLIKAAKLGFRSEQKLSIIRTTGWNWGFLSLQWVNGNWGLLDGSIGCYTAPCSFNAADGNTYTSATGAMADLNAMAELYSYQNIFGNKLPSLWVPNAALTTMNTVTSSDLALSVQPSDSVPWFGYQSWAAWSSYATAGGCSTDLGCLSAFQNALGGNSSGNRTSRQGEETYAGYIQIEYGWDKFLGFDIPVDGNIGLRIVRTEDNVSAGVLVMPSLSKSYCTIGELDTGGNPVTSCADWLSAVQFLGGGTDAAGIAAAVAGQGALVQRPAVIHGYTNLLPSFNFRAVLSDEIQARLAYSETIVRPDLDKTVSSATLTFDFYDASTFRYGLYENAPSGYGGNPNLKPMRARNYDASLEWYFAPSGSVTFSIFHKDLSDYIYEATMVQSFTHPTSGETGSFNYTTFINGSKGKIEGFELAYTQFYDQLPGLWGGFGLQANYTKIYNSGGHNQSGDLTSTFAIANASDTSLPIQGMSNDTFNVALMYAKYGIDARLAYNWRSRYMSASSDANTKLPVWLENYGQLDGSVFYSFLDHYKVGMQVTNILGAKFYTDMGFPNFRYRSNWIEADRKFALVLRAHW